MSLTLMIHLRYKSTFYYVVDSDLQKKNYVLGDLSKCKAKVKVLANA